MPTLRALECLVAVVEHGSLTEAAARLHLTQPSLSHQISTLERELGTPVVERLPRGVRPTSAGRAVLVDARTAVAAADRVVTTARAVAAGTAGRLRIGCAESLTAPLLAPVLRAWQRRHRGVDLQLVEGTSADQLADLARTGELDVVVGPRPTRWDGDVVVLGREEIVVVGEGRAASWAALARAPLIGYVAGNGLGGWLDDVAAGHGVRLEPITRVRQAGTAAQLAAAGLGVALVPTSGLPTGFAGAVRRLRPRLHREIVALTPGPADPLTARFVALAVRRGVPAPAAVARLDG